MGFLDRARKMAEQAQAKLDEAQQQFNQRPGGAKPGDQPVEYDQHGRPVTPTAATPPPTAATPPPTAATPPPTAATPPPAVDDVTPPSADEGSRGGERSETGTAPGDRDEYAPPKLSGGDPLAS
jgi:hypothetical protein